MSPILPASRRSLDLRYNKRNSFIAYINSQNKCNMESPSDYSLSIINKRNSANNIKINYIPRVSNKEITPSNQNIKSQLSKISSSLCLSDKSNNKCNNENEIELDCQNNIERVLQYSAQYGSTKNQKKEVDNINGTTRDTKENKLDVNNINSNGSKTCYDFIDSNLSISYFIII